MLSSAALQKITDFYSVDGVIPGKPIDIEQVKELRKRAEFDVCQKMTGKESGLTQQTQDELGNWDALFHSEVHGVNLSLAAALGFLKGTELQPALPRFDAVQFANVCEPIFRSLLDGISTYSGTSATRHAALPGMDG